MVDYSTGQPQLQVGFYSWQRVKKKGKLPSHASPHWIEFGVNPHQIQLAHSSRLMTGGFSVKTWMPRSAAASAMGVCR